MTFSASLIPEFHIGQRVRVRRRPVEYSCIQCGAKWGNQVKDKKEYYSSIHDILHGERLTFCGCGASFILNYDGWYVLEEMSEHYGRRIVPYTFLEAIEVDTGGSES